MKNLAAAICGVIAVSVAVSTPAQAAWNDDKVTDIIGDVRDIKNQVTGNAPIKRVADDFSAQLNELAAKGFILEESVGDILTWLQSKKEPYDKFVGSPGIRCGDGTPCAEFRTDLEYFFSDLAALRGNFPIIERLGVGDGSHALSIIDNAPPIMLFGLYETMGRIPDWQLLPSLLEDVYDEIGDPEVFALEPIGSGSAGSASVQTNSVATFGLLPKTPTQRFCERKAWAIERQIDPVRMNRLKFIVFAYRQYFGLFEALTSETIGVDIVGEGNETILPNPLKYYLKISLIVFDVVENAVQTFQANLDICRSNNRELEVQVAQCIPLVNAVMPGTRDDIKDLVRTKIDSAFDDGLETGRSEFWMETATIQSAAGEYREAFESYCAAYQTIGSACNGGCQPNSGGGGPKKP